MYENEIYSNKESELTHERPIVQPQSAIQEQFSAQEQNMGYYQASSSAPQFINEEKPKKKKQKKDKKPAGFFTKMIVAACLGICFGLFATGSAFIIGKETGFFDKLNSANKIVTETANASNTTLDNNIQKDVLSTNNISVITTDATKVVERVMPSMVSIMNNYVERISYFGQIMEQDQTATGSGIIVGQNDTELLIATNYHVVANAKTLTVHFNDETDVKAVIKGTDSDMDLAVIAVSLADISDETKAKISIAKMGDSDSLKLGESVIAIGNALGYGQSVTGGYVSALNREIELDDGSKGTFIQTDAAINPGNSGGALLNMNGEVIGINSNKIGGTVIEGIGYAIPISAASPILEDLMTKVTREKVADGESGYLGIIPQSVTQDAAAIYGMPEGVFVYQLDEDTPAAKGGMLRGDIITKLDGNRLTTADELREKLKYYKSGETVQIIVKRNIDGEYTEKVLEVTLGSRPETDN